MEQIIERLRREKAEIEQVDFNQGKADGLEWAKVASYEELLLVEGADDIEDLTHSRIGEFRDYFDVEFEACREHGIDEEKWQVGWLEGVKEFWGQVKPKL